MTYSFDALGLIFGLLSRVAAARIGAAMVSVISTAHWRHGFFMNWGGQMQGEGFEYHLLAVVLVLFIVVRGSGR